MHVNLKLICFRLFIITFIILLCAPPALEEIKSYELLFLYENTHIITQKYNTFITEKFFIIRGIVKEKTTIC